MSNLNQLSTNVDRLLRAHEDVVRAQEEMASHIRNLENNYQNVLNEMVMFQRNMAQQDGLMQNLIQYFLQVENGGFSSSSGSTNATNGSSGLGSNSANAKGSEVVDSIVGKLGDSGLTIGLGINDLVAGAL